MVSGNLSGNAQPLLSKSGASIVTTLASSPSTCHAPCLGLSLCAAGTADRGLKTDGYLLLQLPDRCLQRLVLLLQILRQLFRRLQLLFRLHPSASASSSSVIQRSHHALG
eukprot:110299-Rhodomonas_salina.2